MFFLAVFGVENKEKYLGTYNDAVCPSCGELTRYEIHKSYTCLHIFFIPTVRWNVRYFVKTSCCGSLYELDPAVGKKEEKNLYPEISKENLRRINNQPAFKYCSNCRANLSGEFGFCPYCGGRL